MSQRLDSKMVNAEVARLEKMFHEIDTNKDGVIDIQELTAGLRKMGYYHITREQIEVKQFYLSSESYLFGGTCSYHKHLVLGFLSIYYFIN